jgi:hypothetical protein
MLTRAAWTGIFASVVGILFSILVMMIEVSHLLFYFLTTPQGGVQVVQTTGSDSASWVSAVDMLSLLALIVTLLVELIVLASGLWLLYRTLFSEYKFNKAAVGSADLAAEQADLAAEQADLAAEQADLAAEQADLAAEQVDPEA